VRPSRTNTVSTAQARILVVDDEPQMLENLRRLLVGDGHTCETLSNPAAFDTAYSEFAPDILIVDLRMPGTDGLELMGRAHAIDPTIPVLVITGHATVPSAVEAIRQGAFDYLAKPFTADQLSVAVGRALRFRGLVIENQELREKVGTDAGMIATSPAMARIMDQVRRVAGTDASILITGESGTGKELIARTIHSMSLRSQGPFVPIDCAALPEGLLESELYGHERGAFTGAVANKKGLLVEAHGGTLLLDEIGDMTQPLQAKLLRVLEERKVRSVGSSTLIDIDIRMIAATNVDLEDAVAAGVFREDLFYRLNVIHLRLPPLRERVEDIPLIAERFLERAIRGRRSVPRLEGAARLRLEAHHWPGNVRELRNVMERAAALDEDGVIGVDDLPPELGRDGLDFAHSPSASELGSLAYDEAREIALKGFLRVYVTEALSLHGNNVTRAAQASGVSRRTFHRWMADLSATNGNIPEDEQ